MASLHAARAAQSDAHQMSALAFLEDTELLAATGSACDAIQGFASTVEATDFCACLPEGSRRPLQKISARAWSAQHFFMNPERAGTPCSDGFLAL